MTFSIINCLRCEFKVLNQFGHQFKRYYPRLPKRFYGEVEVIPENNGTFSINLDHRKLRTPSKSILKLKSYELALGIAEEWKGQGSHIQQAFMHLTSLANTVQDNPFRKTKFDLVNEILAFLTQDTILYWDKENEKLYGRQSSNWGPVIQWFENEFKATIPISKSLFETPNIKDEDLAEFRSYLSMCSFEALHGFLYACSSLRSVILTTAITKNHLPLIESVQYSRLETTVQVENWGNIEWSHDVEYNETLARVSSGILFFNFNSKI